MGSLVLRTLEHSPVYSPLVMYLGSKMCQWSRSSLLLSQGYPLRNFKIENYIRLMGFKDPFTHSIALSSICMEYN